MPTTRRPMRRARVLLPAAAALLALAACSVDTGAAGDDRSAADGATGSTQGTSGDGGGSAAGRTLTVTAFAGAWSDTFTEAFVEPFEKRTGATVVLVPGASAEWLTKLRAADGNNPPYDLMAFTPDITPQAVRTGVISELDTGKIEHFDELSTVLVEHAGYQGKTYGVPLTTGSTGLAYRTDKIKTPPKDWSDIFDEEYCGHVAMAPLTYNPGLEFMAGLIQEQGGEMSDPAAVDSAFDSLNELSDCVSTFPADSGSMQTALQNGDAWIAPWWDGRVFAMEQQGVPVGFTYPASGAVGALTSYYLAAGSANTDLAYEFLSELSKAGNQKVFAEGTWYAASNGTIDYSKDFSDRIKYGDKVYQGFAWVDYDTAIPNLNAWQQKWNTIFS